MNISETIPTSFSVSGLLNSLLMRENYRLTTTSNSDLTMEDDIHNGTSLISPLEEENTNSDSYSVDLPPESSRTVRLAGIGGVVPVAAAFSVFIVLFFLICCIKIRQRIIWHRQLKKCKPPSTIMVIREKDVYIKFCKDELLHI